MKFFTGSVFEKHIKKVIVVGNFLGVLGASIGTLAICYGFFYEQKEHSKAIEEIRMNDKIRDQKIDELIISNSIYKERSANMEKKVDRIETNQEKALEVVYKIYEKVNTKK